MRASLQGRMDNMHILLRAGADANLPKPVSWDLCAIYVANIYTWNSVAYIHIRINLPQCGATAGIFASSLEAKVLLRAYGADLGLVCSVGEMNNKMFVVMVFSVVCGCCHNELN